MECEYFTVISIDSLLVYENKFYLQVYLDNFVYTIVNELMTDIVLKIRYYRCCITIELI